MNISSKSGGRLYYLGDWHIHLENNLYPSATDIKAMEILLKEIVTPWPWLFSLILHKELKTYRLYQFERNKLFKEVQIIFCRDPFFISDYKNFDFP